MLREQSKLVNQVHKTLDICLTTSAFIFAYFIKRYILPDGLRGLTIVPNYYVILLLIIIIWFICFAGFNLYQSYRRRSFGEIFLNMVKAVSTGMLVLTLLLYLLKITDISRILLGTFYLLNIITLTISKGLTYRALQKFRKNGFNFRSVLIVGSQQRAIDAIDTIGDRLGAGFKVIGCLDVDPDRLGLRVQNGCKVIDVIDNLEVILRTDVVDELVFAMPLKEIKGVARYILMAEKMGVSVRIIPDWQLHYLMYKPGVARINFEEFLGIPTMALHTTPPNACALLVKTSLDYTLAAIFIAFCLPLFLFFTVAIKLSSRGPVVFKQERLGLNGRHFQVYKFRTMVADAEFKRKELEALNEADGPVFKIRNDPRVIPIVGTFLRKTSLDELPQLFNVLSGEMSLVGPRPPIPGEVDEYELWHRRRLSMKPGLTCLWQCAPKRNDISFAEWMKMDLKYIDNWSLWLDFKILFTTAKVVFMEAGR